MEDPPIPSLTDQQNYNVKMGKVLKVTFQASTAPM